MGRYFVQKASKALWIDDEVRVKAQEAVPTVCDHEATDTGLLDMNGDAIMRAPLAIGFGRWGDW